MASFTSLLSVAWLLTIGVAGTQQVSVSHVEAAYGPLWPKRNSSVYYLPQDHIFFRFAVNGAKFKNGSDINVDVETKLVDAKKKTVLSRVRPFQGNTMLGGKSFLCFAHLPLMDGLKPGRYQFQVTVTDNNTFHEATFERAIELRKPDLAVKSVQFFYDNKFKHPAPTNFQVGQRVFFRMQVIGLEPREGTLTVRQKCEIIDQKTGDVMPKFYESTAKQAEIGRGGVWTVSGLTGLLTRPGYFVLRLTIEDRNTGKHLRFDAPIRVHRLAGFLRPVSN